jgi:acylphosphatase
VASYRFLVRGRVQGVGYRYFVLREAEGLGVSGFTRNLPDGSVEVVAEGEDPVLQQLEARLREGPSFAKVAAVERVEVSPRGGQGFHIR